MVKIVLNCLFNSVKDKLKDYVDNAVSFNFKELHELIENINNIKKIPARIIISFI